MKPNENIRWIDTAILLAAGFGKRMRPLTNNTPKPLIRVAGKTLLEWNINYLMTAGITKIIINTHYLATQIKEFIENSDFDAQIIISHEPEILDQAGGVKQALSHVGQQQQLLILNSDGIFIDDNNSSNAISMVTAEYQKHRQPINIVTYPVNKLTNIDMPAEIALNPLRYTKNTNSTHVYTGVLLLERNYIEQITDKVVSMRPILFNNTANTSCIDYQGTWLHVSDPKSHAKAELLLGNYN
ncbi:MAG: sugar phosphate nucleotidyltransferase [Pseudomonadota bacterium]